jgi:hypothetical protein
MFLTSASLWFRFFPFIDLARLQYKPVIHVHTLTVGLEETASVCLFQIQDVQDVRSSPAYLLHEYVAEVGNRLAVANIECLDYCRLKYTGVHVFQTAW